MRNRRENRSFKKSLEMLCEVSLRNYISYEIFYKGVGAVLASIIYVIALFKIDKRFLLIPNIPDVYLYVILGISLLILSGLAFIDNLSDSIKVPVLKSLLLKFMIILAACDATGVATYKQREQDLTEQINSQLKSKTESIHRDSIFQDSLKSLKKGIVKDYTQALLEFGLDWKQDKIEILKSVNDTTKRKFNVITSNGEPDISIVKIISVRRKDTIDFSMTIKNNGSKAQDVNINLYMMIDNNGVIIGLQSKPFYFLNIPNFSTKTDRERGISTKISYYNLYYMLFLGTYKDDNNKILPIKLLYLYDVKSNGFGEPLPRYIPAINSFLKTNLKLKDVQF
jgi:predicted  nucleic acid-binding Zn-ribbon protein